MDDSDFTFCQVHTSGTVEGILESPKIILSIDNIVIDGSTTDVVGNNETSDLPREDNSCNIDSLVEVNGSTNSELKIYNPDKQDSLGQVNGQLEPSQCITRKPVTRAKVPFEKGFSQMDWLKLTRSHPDLAGLRGQSNRRRISIDEVRQHKTGGAIWTVLKGRVYNILPYMKFHPGGVDMLTKAAGKDCTAIFNKYHAWVNAEFLLEKCLVGILDDSQ